MRATRLLLGAALVIGAVSCTGGKDGNGDDGQRQEANHNLKFVSYSYDMIVENLSDSTDTSSARYIRYSGEGILPEAIGDDNVRALRDSLERLAGVRFEDGSPMPRVEREMRVTELNPDTIDACSTVSASLSASLVNPRVVAFEMLGGSYECPAAHGMSSLTCVNYCVNEGKIIEFGDIVKGDARADLLRLVRACIRSMDVPLIVNVEDIGIPDEFAVTSDGIDFIYQPYDIAPYSEGIVRVSISTGDLVTGRFLTPEGEYIFTGQRPASR